MKNIAIAYCIDNIKIAEEIERQLSRAPYTFDHFYCKRSTSEDPLSNQLRSKRGTILLIISDNFLKSAQCMNNSLRLLQERSNDILPIIVDGQSRDEQTGAWSSTPTHFDRVSDIIKYINYWQDQYLDLRKQKRQVHDMDEERFNEHLRVMREISGEIGEFLRTLRNLPYLSYEEFTNNKFEAFFRYTNDDNAWRNFRELPALEPMRVNAATEVAEPDFNISDIPGINLLEKSPVTPMQEEPVHQSEPIVEAPQPVSHNTFEFVQEALDTPVKAEIPQPESVLPAEPLLNTPHTNGLAKTEAAPDERQIQSWIEESGDSARTGNALEALNFLAGLLEKYPNINALRYHYALLLAQHTEHFTESVNQLEVVLESEPENEDALMLMGQLAELKQDFLLAKNSYEKVLDGNDENAQAFYRLGMVTIAAFPDQTEQATKYFKKAAKYDPENLDALYRYASLLAEDEDEADKAIKQFKKLLEAQPEHPFANYDLALLYHQEGKNENAREHYLRAIKLNPELKTPENDALFEYKIPAATIVPVAATATIDPHFAVDTIELLKQNIAQLENMLKQQEAVQLQQQQQPEPAPPSRIGEGKTVLITGATAGIGRATAEFLAEHGFRLILTGRRKNRLDELAEHLEEEFSTEIKTLHFDVRNVEEVNQAIENLEENWRSIDVLINNAGKAKGFSPIQKGELRHWEEMIDTNLKGLLYMTRAVTPHMVQRGQGHIINIGSIAGKEVYPNGNVYCATKFAVDALTRGMRLDLVNHNIRVSQVTPGHVEETEFALVRFDGDAEKAKIYEGFKPLTSHDIANAIYYILTCPPHVNVQDIVIMGTQQASATVINRSGREQFESEQD